MVLVEVVVCSVVFGSTRVVMVVVLMLVFGVVCDVDVVLVWCWCSGVGVGGAVVCGVWWEVETYQTSRNPFFLGDGKVLPKF